MSDPVEEEAARWALWDSDNPAERRKLDSWLAADPRHAGALLRAQAALSCIDRALFTDPQCAPERAAATFPLLSRRRTLAGAGSMAVALVAGYVGWPLLRGKRITTARGEIRRLPLEDGSVATIDTESELRLLMVGQSRHIELERGQAWFQVAKDPQRPFVVDAGIAQIKAVGTAFAVRRTKRFVRVSVTEGTVIAWADRSAGTMSVVNQGQYVSFVVDGDTPVIGTDPATINRLLAWRDGEISLEGETLGSAVIEFNRYNRQQIVLASPGLGEERLVGLFKLGDPLQFAGMLSRSLGIVVTVTPAQIRLERKISAPV